MTPPGPIVGGRSVKPWHDVAEDRCTHGVRHELQILAAEAATSRLARAGRALGSWALFLEPHAKRTLFFNMIENGCEEKILRKNLLSRPSFSYVLCRSR